jgi:hypothetical protein
LGGGVASPLTDLPLELGGGGSQLSETSTPRAFDLTRSLHEDQAAVMSRIDEFESDLFDGGGLDDDAGLLPFVYGT